MNAAPAAKKFKYGPFICDGRPPKTRYSPGLGPGYNGPNLVRNQPEVKKGRVIISYNEKEHVYHNCPLDAVRLFEMSREDFKKEVGCSPTIPQRHEGKEIIIDGVKKVYCSTCAAFPEFVNKRFELEAWVPKYFKAKHSASLKHAQRVEERFGMPHRIDEYPYKCSQIHEGCSVEFARKSDYSNHIGHKHPFPLELLLGTKGSKTSAEDEDEDDEVPSDEQTPSSSSDHTLISASHSPSSTAVASDGSKSRSPTTSPFDYPVPDFAPPAQDVTGATPSFVFGQAAEEIPHFRHEQQFFDPQGLGLFDAIPSAPSYPSVPQPHAEATQPVVTYSAPPAPVSTRPPPPPLPQYPQYPVQLVSRIRANDEYEVNQRFAKRLRPQTYVPENPTYGVRSHVPVGNGHAMAGPSRLPNAAGAMGSNAYGHLQAVEGPSRLLNTTNAMGSNAYDGRAMAGPSRLPYAPGAMGSHGYHPHGRTVSTTHVLINPSVVPNSGFEGYHAAPSRPSPPPHAPHRHQTPQRSQRAFQPPSHIYANAGTQVAFNGPRISQRRNGRGQLAQPNPYSQKQMRHPPPSNSFSHPPSQHVPYDAQTQNANEAPPPVQHDPQDPLPPSCPMTEVFRAGLHTLSTDEWLQKHGNKVLQIMHGLNPT